MGLVFDCIKGPQMKRKIKHSDPSILSASHALFAKALTFEKTKESLRWNGFKSLINS